MSAPTPASSTKKHQDYKLAFLRGFLDKPKEVGSFIPSSRFMEKRIVNNSSPSHGKACD